MRKGLIAILSLFLLAACGSAGAGLQIDGTLGELTIKQAQVEPQDDGSAIVTMIIDNDGGDTYVLDKIELADGSEIPLFEGETTNREISQGDVIEEGDNDPIFPDRIAAQQVVPREIPLVQVGQDGLRLSKGTAFALIPEFNGQVGDTVQMTVFFGSDGTVMIEVPVVDPRAD
jgi:hypothetical protein